MREALYQRKAHMLTYFNSKNTQITVNCYSVLQARQILKNSQVEQELRITRLQ